MAIDIMFFIALATGFYLGYSRGIIKTVFSLASLFIGALAAFKFAPGMTRFLETSFNNNNPLMFLAGAALSFVLAMLVIRMIGRGMENALKSANINVINQLLGGVVSAAFMLMVYSTLVWFGDQANIVNNEAKAGSITYPIVQVIPEKSMIVIKKIIPIFQEFWDQSVDMMDRLKGMSIEKTEDNNVYDIPTDEETEDSDY
jgi:membrane protein required for colicin V production